MGRKATINFTEVSEAAQNAARQIVLCYCGMGEADLSRIAVARIVQAAIDGVPLQDTQADGAGPIAVEVEEKVHGWQARDHAWTEGELASLIQKAIDQSRLSFVMRETPVCELLRRDSSGHYQVFGPDGTVEFDSKEMSQKIVRLEMENSGLRADLNDANRALADAEDRARRANSWSWASKG